jgi:NAD(P)-dependent dehydrogenase (short-subunit alcohol dehydrogenase family)
MMSVLERRFDGEVVVVSGAGGGLGRCYALELARRGAHVVVNDLGGATDGLGSSDAAATRVVEEIRAAGGMAVANFDTVATAEGGEAIIRTALDTWGRIDAVIANAGILRDKTFIKQSVADIKAVIDVNLLGTIFLAQPAMRWMRDNDVAGRFVLTTSASGLFGNFGQANYTAAKLGVVGLMRTLAIEGKRYNIRVNCISPVAGTRLTAGQDVGPDDPSAPAKVAPLVAAMAHRDWPRSGEAYLAAGGWYARAFVALAEGWVAGTNNNVESIFDNIDALCDAAGAAELGDAMAISGYLDRKVRQKAD